MRKNLPIALAALVVMLLASLSGFSQSCSLLTHNSFTNFNATPKPPAATSLWLNIHTKLGNTNLVNNGDYLLFTGGTISLNGVTSTPAVTNVSIPKGMIIADNTVSSPVTSYDVGSNTWTTKVPPGYSTSDIFISGAIINSSTGFSVTANKSSTISGYFFSNRPSFKQSWFYGLAAYEPQFSYSDIGNAGQVASVGGGIKAGTPIPEEQNLVAGGSGGGGSNFTGSYSSTDNFMTCQQVCTSSLSVSVSDLRNDFNFTCDGQATINVTGGVGPFTYNWSDGVTTSTNSRSNLCGPTLAAPGTPVLYTVVVTDANGCTGSVSFYIDFTSIPPSAASTSLKIGTASAEVIKPTIAKAYPNPSSGLVHLQVYSGEKADAVISVTDMMGRTVKSFTINLDKGINNKDLQLQNHSGGLYRLQIKTNKEVQALSILLN